MRQTYSEYKKGSFSDLTLNLLAVLATTVCQIAASWLIFTFWLVESLMLLQNRSNDYLKRVLVPRMHDESHAQL